MQLRSRQRPPEKTQSSSLESSNMNVPDLNQLTVFNILEDGIEKLEEYQQETDSAPAYTVSICE
jgi:hypothetical protein